MAPYFRDSSASHVRHTLAAKLADRCPPSLSQEIMLTGSVARGFADEHSDIELAFYCESLPSLEEREAWLRSIGAREMTFDTEAIADGSLWATFLYRDVWVESGWQTFATQERNLQAILSGTVIDHHLLLLGSMLLSALPLRTSGVLAVWQQRLAHYPEELRSRLIEDALEIWTFPHLIAARRALIARGELFTFTSRLVWAVQNILRLLFALNRQWEPDWKWLPQITTDLPLQPEQLVPRINAIFAGENPEQSFRLCLQLLHDTIVLLPVTPQLSCALATLQPFLQP